VRQLEACWYSYTVVYAKLLVRLVAEQREAAQSRKTNRPTRPEPTSGDQKVAFDPKILIWIDGVEIVVREVEEEIAGI
jgi:hypothetical protein